MNKMKVWLEATPQPDPFTKLRSFAECVVSKDTADLVDCDVAAMSSLPMCNAAWMDAAGASLKVIARFGVGVDNVDVPAATERGITVINTPEAPSESTAEHTIALMMSLAKRVPFADQFTRGAQIARDQLRGTEMKGRTLGILGLGRIGRRVAEMAALGIRMRVIGYDPYIDPDRLPFVEFVSSVETLLAQSDFVSFNLALTPDTRGLMDATRFAQMKRGAYFINCSRGGTVNEPALYDALKSGHLAGAALDVYQVEPPALDHPLLTLPNVIATPHVASFTDMGLRLMSEGVVDQLEQLAHGERPTHVVNPQVLPGRLADWLR